MSSISFLFLQFGKMTLEVIIGSNRISLYFSMNINGSKTQIGCLAASVLLIHCDNRLFAASTMTQYISSATSWLEHLFCEGSLLVLLVWLAVLPLAVEFLRLWLGVALQQLLPLFALLTILVRAEFALPLCVFVGLLLGSCWVGLALPPLFFTSPGQVYIRNSAVLYALFESPNTDRIHRHATVGDGYQRSKWDQCRLDLVTGPERMHISMPHADYEVQRPSSSHLQL